MTPTLPYGICPVGHRPGHRRCRERRQAGRQEQVPVIYGTARSKRLYAAVVEAGYISGMTLFMAATSSFLGFMLARDLVAHHVVAFVTQISTDRYVVILLVSLVFIVLGMILESPAMIFGFLPSFMPLLAKVGVDPVYWGVLFCTNMGLGCIIPPVAR